jgi:hypothetical protein
MAQFKGFGITIEVRSNDHGELGKASEPAHAHILDNSGKEIAEIVLTRKTPEKPSDVIWYRTDFPPDGLAARVIKLASKTSDAAKKLGLNLTTWQNVLNQWLIFHGK